MRFALAVLFALPLVTPAADPKEPPKQPGVVWFDNMQRIPKLLAKVTDEKSAKDAKAELDDLHTAGRKDRAAVYEKWLRDLPDGELAERMAVLAKQVGESSAETATEYARIALNQKAAFKVLRETKLFTELETLFDVKATTHAMNLVNVARAQEAKLLGPIKKLTDLAPYLEKGNKALSDPWGFPYQFKYIEDEKQKRSRLVIYTVSPITKKPLGHPKELVELIDK